MGRATVVENVGEGLYRVRLDYDLGPLDKELETLSAQLTEWAANYIKALNTRDQLKQARDDTALALSAVIQQWLDAIITANGEPPPDLPLEDEGSTVEEEQEAALLDAINAQRSGDLTRAAALDSAAGLLLETLANTGRLADVDSTPEQRAYLAGYNFDGSLGVGVAVQAGATSAVDAVARMMLSTRNTETIQSEDWEEIGVAYHYRAGSPYAYFWGAFFAAPGTPPPDVAESTDNNAKDAAEESTDELERIEIPTLDSLEPDQLAEVSAAFAKAARRYTAAADAVARLELEKTECEDRIATLQQLKTIAETPIYAWACQYVTDLATGSTVFTAEVPGWYLHEGRAAEVVIDDQTVAYTERDVNLVPGDSRSQLRHAEAMSAGLVFANLALEPGHLKWRPKWRYATVTARQGSTCAITLDTVDARTASGIGTGLDLNEALTFSNVPISYPCPEELHANDVVLIQFDDQDRTKPRVIGFRREPRECPYGRVSWTQY